MDAIAGWHDFVRTRDAKRLHDLLDPDVVFESPVVHTPQEGRAITLKYLLGAMQMLGTDAFRYTGEWRSDTGAVLEFETIVDGVAVNGVDIIHLTPDNRRIARFKVLIRPLKGVQAVHRAMGALFA